MRKLFKSVPKRLRSIQSEEIVLLRTLHRNKASGSGGIYGQMLLLCNNHVFVPANKLSTKTFRKLLHNLACGWL